MTVRHITDLIFLNRKFSSLKSLSSRLLALCFLSFTLCFLSLKTQAQTDVKIGLNPGSKTASAVLEVESTTKGFLMPRLTTIQLNAISSPATGLMVFNTIDSCVYIYRGTTGGWQSTCSASYTGGWSLLGNAGTSAATNFLGTTDAKPIVFRTNSAEGMRLDATGHLGIGNTNPTYFLDLNAASNVLRIQGLSGGFGTVTDSIMTITSATGVVNKRSMADVISSTNTAWLLGGNNLAAAGSLGTTSAQDMNIVTNGTTRLSVTSAGAITQTGAGAVTFTGATNATNGLAVTNAALTATAGATLTGTNVNLNNSGANTTTIGNVLSTTNINGTALNLTSLASGVATDSIVSVNAATGAVHRLSIANVISSGITANNGLTKTGTNIALGGALTASTTITQATNDFIITGGNVGIGAAGSPNSTFQLTGSMSVSYRKVIANTTLASTDYVVLANATAGAFTLTLPTASTCTGRIYVIGKSDESTNTVTFSPALTLTETTTVPSLSFAKKYRVVSDGSNWVILNE